VGALKAAIFCLLGQSLTYSPILKDKDIRAIPTWTVYFFRGNTPYILKDDFSFSWPTRTEPCISYDNGFNLYMSEISHIQIGWNPERAKVSIKF
jgi:hypothetical protein